MKSDLLSPKVAWFFTVLGAVLTVLFVRSELNESSTSPVMDMTGGRLGDVLYGFFMMIIMGIAVMSGLSARRELDRMKALKYTIEDEAAVRRNVRIALVLDSLMGFFAFITLLEQCT